MKKQSNEIPRAKTFSSLGEKNVTYLVILILFILSLLLRLPGNQSRSFDLDEMATASWILAPDWKSLLAFLWTPFEGNSLGYPILIQWWAKISITPFWIRFLSALFGALSIVIFYFIESRNNRHLAGLLSALFLALSFFPMLIAQQARAYSLYGFVSLLSYFFFLNLMQKNDASHKPRPMLEFGLVLTLLCGIYLHHIAFLYAFSLFGFGLWNSPPWIRKRILFLGMIIFILYLPHIPLLVFQLKNGPQWIPSITFMEFVLNMKRLFQSHADVSSVFLFLLALVGVFQKIRKQEYLELIWVFFPMISLVALSLSVRNLFLDRYLFPSSLGFFLFVTEGFAFFLNKKGTWKLGTLSLALFFFVVAAKNLPDFYRTPRGADFKGAAAAIVAKQNFCGKKVVTDIRLLKRWPYYLPKDFVLSGLNDPLPPEPFWIVIAGYATPPHLNLILTNSSNFLQGYDFTLGCIKGQRK